MNSRWSEEEKPMKKGRRKMKIRKKVQVQSDQKEAGRFRIPESKIERRKKSESFNLDSHEISSKSWTKNSISDFSRREEEFFEVESGLADIFLVLFNHVVKIK